MKKLSQKTADEFCNNEYCDQEISTGGTKKAST